MGNGAAQLDRLQDGNGSIIMVPMDHGISMGPVVDPVAILRQVGDHATCVTVHKGLLAAVAPFAEQVGVLMHLSASTDLAPDPHEKRLVGTVAEAVARGAIGVSTHLNLGCRTEADQLQDLGRVSTDCLDHGVPHLAMIYPRGPNIADPFDPDLVAHAARLGVELGADIVKVPYTGDAGSFEPVVEGALGVPVIVAGGPKTDSFDHFVERLRGAKEAGAAGVSIGRNIFQHDDPAAAMKAIADVFA